MLAKILRLLLSPFAGLFLCLLPMLVCGSMLDRQAKQPSVSVAQAKPDTRLENISRIANTAILAPTSTPVPITAKVNSSANLRKGPGTNFDVVGGKTVGDVVAVVGCNEACDWHKLSTGEWVAAFLISVEGIEEVVDTSDPAVQKYLVSVTTNLMSMGDALEDTFETLDRFSANPYDSSWQADLLVNFVGILYPCRLINDTNAPRDLKTLHAQISEGCTHLTNVVNYLTKLIDTGNTSYTDIIESELDLGLSLFTAVAESLDKIATERTITKIVPVPTIAERKYTPVLVPTPTPIITPTAVPLANL